MQDPLTSGRSCVVCRVRSSSTAASSLPRRKPREFVPTLRSSSPRLARADCTAAGSRCRSCAIARSFIGCSLRSVPRPATVPAGTRASSNSAPSRRCNPMAILELVDQPAAQTEKATSKRRKKDPPRPSTRRRARAEHSTITTMTTITNTVPSPSARRLEPEPEPAQSDEPVPSVDPKSGPQGQRR